MAKHFLYTLVFDTRQGPVVFYVGHTNNPERRETEHRSSAKNPDNTEYKYQWCRELEAVNQHWDFVVVGEIEDDEDAEYSWVLKFARDNQDRGITFIDGLPLTNMRRGDFLEEILSDRTINTAKEIREYRQTRTNRVSSYTGSAVSNMVVSKLNEQVELARIQRHEEKIRSIERDLKYQEMIADPDRADRIRAENLRLEAEIRSRAVGQINNLLDAHRYNTFPQDQPEKLVKRK